MADDRQTRLNEVARVAVKIETETGVPSHSTVAQWAVESQWGAKPVGQANYFGIKRAARHTKYAVVTTREFFTDKQIANWNSKNPGNPAKPTGKKSPDGTKSEVMLDDQFADYENLEESVRDYAWLVTNGRPYSGAWGAYQTDKDVPKFVAGIATAYSTSPDYTALVNTIAGQNNVTTAIAAAKSA
jgi:flagellum-specific peptidoglycan hydrolase FlgJ